jgi:hypothetical protein
VTSRLETGNSLTFFYSAGKKRQDYQTLLLSFDLTPQRVKGEYYLPVVQRIKRLREREEGPLSLSQLKGEEEEPKKIRRQHKWLANWEMGG